MAKFPGGALKLVRLPPEVRAETLDAQLNRRVLETLQELNSTTALDTGEYEALEVFESRKPRETRHRKKK
jgi:hypothetical protein